MAGNVPAETKISGKWLRIPKKLRSPSPTPIPFFPPPATARHQSRHRNTATVSPVPISQTCQVCGVKYE